MQATGWLGALGGVGIVLAILIATEFLDRYDAWMRRNGFSWMMVGSRESGVGFKWLFRLLLSALGVFFIVLFFERL